MSIDRLQEKIRKLKNPTVVEFTACLDQIPPHLLQDGTSFVTACGRYYTELLLALKDVVPAVRFSLAGFALLGAQGLELLTEMTKTAKKTGFYVLLDGMDAVSSQIAQMSADALFAEKCPWEFDGLVLSSYIGSDGIKPYAERLKDSGKSLFVALRTSNKSAAEIQDLLTGSRHVYLAKADIVNRFGQPLQGRCGYSQIGGMGAAASADVLRTLRSKYKNMFLLVEGYDYPNANAKNCSFAFDSFGHGAAVCVGESVVGAWREEENTDEEYVDCAVRGAERMKKNLLHYITVL